jgi:hypothetical protein
MAIKKPVKKRSKARRRWKPDMWLDRSSLQGVPVDVAALAEAWEAAVASPDPQMRIRESHMWSVELSRRSWLLRFTDDASVARALVKNAADARATVRWADEEVQMPRLSRHQILAAVRAEVERRSAERGHKSRRGLSSKR